ncbi:hypothetical protein CIB48_g7930 [Xylaria polymorpha]|nr:hypothetical protein CIB48_g7930 [Xylaria polymorpha]
MPSLNTILATATLLLSSVKAEEQYYVEPSSVPLSTRDNWCQQEKSTCPIICEQLPPGGYQTNDCDPERGAAATTSAGQIFDGLGGDGDSDSDSGDSKPKNGASPLLQYGTFVGGLALAACVGLGSLIL